MLGKNYPETYWYRQSLRLLAAERDHTHGKAFGTTAAAEPAPKAAKGRKR